MKLSHINRPRRPRTPLINNNKSIRRDSRELRQLNTPRYEYIWRRAEKWEIAKITGDWSSGRENVK